MIYWNLGLKVSDRGDQRLKGAEACSFWYWRNNWHVVRRPNGRQWWISSRSCKWPSRKQRLQSHNHMKLHPTNALNDLKENHKTQRKEQPLMTPWFLSHKLQSREAKDAMPNSWCRETEIINMCFKLLIWVICYATIERIAALFIIVMDKP